jgi:hypothetical protein
MADTAGHAQSAAGKMHDAFSATLAALNQTGVLGPFGAALDGVDQALETISKHGKDVGLAMIGVGGAMAGIGVGLSALGSKDQAAHQQLQAAVQATGKDYDDYGKAVEEAIKHQENFGHSSAETQDALTKLTEATHDPTKALQLLNETSDVAAAKHESLSEAATAVGKVYNGNTKLLKEFGVTIDKATGQTKDHQTATEALAKVVSGQATAAQDTFAGRLDVIKTKLEDTAASMGQKYGPAVTGIGTLLAGLGSAWSVISAIMAADWFAAFWPVALIVVAIAGVGVAIYLMRDKFVEVFQWIEKNWPLLVEIIVGPFGVAAVQIYQNWDAIMRFFKALPGQVAAVFVDVWHGIVTAFRDVLNAVIDLWNALHFTLPKVDVLGVHLGGETIGVPSIPHLAQGGLITQTGLVYAHAGEAITPMPGALGPAVHIENATFNQPVDLALLNKTVEWATGAGLRAAV